MSKDLFKQARRLIKRLEYEGKGRDSEFYVFKFGDGSEVPIQLESTEEGTQILCKCKMHGIYGPRSNKICLYKNALTLYKAGIKQ